MNIIKNIHEKHRSCVHTPEGLTYQFAATSDLLQGCSLSPQLVNLLSHTTLSMLKNHVGVIINDVIYDTLAYACDLDRLAQTEASELKSASNNFGMRISPKKTKVIQITKDTKITSRAPKIQNQRYNERTATIATT